jgi:predicted transcriptional regulator
LDDTEANQFDNVELAAEIVAAYVKNNSVSPSELPKLLTSIHAALNGIATGHSPSAPEAEPAVEKATPAQIRKSIAPDGLISFVDGKRYKTLKRHLGTHGLDPQAYRQRYGLPTDYPMVSPNYAKQRSDLAKNFGLGRKA